MFLGSFLYFPLFPSKHTVEEEKKRKFPIESFNCKIINKNNYTYSLPFAKIISMSRNSRKETKPFLSLSIKLNICKYQTKHLNVNMNNLVTERGSKTKNNWHTILINGKGTEKKKHMNSLFSVLYLKWK